MLKIRSGKSVRRPTSLKNEIAIGYPGIRVAGVDEVGRGCLAGAVVAGAILLPPTIDRKKAPWLKWVTDSKLLTHEAREDLAPRIEEWASSYAIGVASVEEIDRINIYHASHLAMLRALQGLDQQPEHIMVDGNVVPKDLPCSATAVIKGDLKCLSIAAASILAKVWRDREMKRLAEIYPGYGFAEHKGYSTPVHFKALKELGACVIHRRSFAPVAATFQLSLGSITDEVTCGKIELPDPGENFI